MEVIIKMVWPRGEVTSLMHSAQPHIQKVT